MTRSTAYNKQAEGIPQNAYYYDGQLKSYILQFMAIFSGLQVKIGKRKTGAVANTTDCAGDVTDTQPVFEDERLISVPIHYGAQDRVVAAILDENTQNKLLRLPVLSAYAKGLAFKKEWAAGINVERRNVMVPEGGLVPDDIQVVHQLRPYPFDMSFELGIYVSNTDQHFQILEQILPLFTPQLQIQINDAVLDFTRDTVVELTDLTFDQNYPSGTDRRVIQSTLNFTMPVWLSIPADVRKDYIAKIFLRIGAVSSASFATSEDLIAELDAQGITYDLISDLNNLTIK